MSGNWVDVPQLVDGLSTFTAGSINPSISALVNRTDELKSRLDGIGGISAVGLCYRDTGLTGSGIARGTIVCYDKESGEYIPAAAQWDYSDTDAGKLIPSNSSYVIGVLVSDVDQYTGEGSILCNGTINSASLIDVLASEGPGDYYLTSNGNASLTPPERQPRIYCYTRTASGKLIFNPQSPEYGGHTHDKYRLNSGWQSVTGSAVPSAIRARYAVTSKCFKLTVTENNYPGLAASMDAVGSDMTLCLNGLILSANSWCIVSNEIFIAESVEASDSVELFLISPILGNRTTITDIKSDSDLFSFDVARGTAYLYINQESVHSTEPSGVAVAGIDNSGVAMVSVVNEIHPGLGISITPRTKSDGSTVPGSFDITANTALRTKLELNITNLNGVIFGGSSSGIGYIFPQGVRASMSGYVRTPYSDARIGARLHILAETLGTSIDTFEITGKSYDSTSLTSTSIRENTVLASAGSGGLTDISVDLGEVGSDTLLSLSLSATQNTAVEVLSVSLELYNTQ